MRSIRHVVIPVFLLTAGLLAAGSTLIAHEVTYQGTVVTAKPAALEIKTVDAKTKQVGHVSFVLDVHTKIERGTRIVSFEDAKILPGERVAVLVDHDAETKMLASEIRLPKK